jgi:hypothetical protein
MRIIGASKYFSWKRRVFSLDLSGVFMEFKNSPAFEKNGKNIISIDKIVAAYSVKYRRAPNYLKIEICETGAGGFLVSTNYAIWGPNQSEPYKNEYVKPSLENILEDALKRILQFDDDSIPDELLFWESNGKILYDGTGKQVSLAEAKRRRANYKGNFMEFENSRSFEKNEKNIIEINRMIVSGKFLTAYFVKYRRAPSDFQIGIWEFESACETKKFMSGSNYAIWTPDQSTPYKNEHYKSSKEEAFQSALESFLQFDDDSIPDKLLFWEAYNKILYDGTGQQISLAEAKRRRSDYRNAKMHRSIGCLYGKHGLSFRKILR